MYATEDTCLEYYIQCRAGGCYKIQRQHSRSVTHTLTHRQHCYAVFLCMCVWVCLKLHVVPGRPAVCCWCSKNSEPCHISWCSHQQTRLRVCEWKCYTCAVFTKIKVSHAVLIISPFGQHACWESYSDHPFLCHLFCLTSWRFLVETFTPGWCPGSVQGFSRGWICLKQTSARPMEQDTQPPSAGFL